MGKIKTLVIIIAIGFGGFLYYFKDISPYSPNMSDPSERKAWGSHLEKERESASFLNLDDAVLVELKESRPHDSIATVIPEEIGKEKLFEEPNKGNYHF